jgi:peptidoglycan hydrolase-like protein with peptidoglycan-binding domain
MPVLVDPPADKPAARKKTPREVSFEPFRTGVKLGGRTIGLGSAGDDVVRLQKILNRRPRKTVTLALDGLFGPKTEAEVRKLQRALKVKADGVVGRDTWSALGW